MSAKSRHEESLEKLRAQWVAEGADLRAATEALRQERDSSVEAVEKDDNEKMVALRTH